MGEAGLAAGRSDTPQWACGWRAQVAQDNLTSFVSDGRDLPRVRLGVWPLNPQCSSSSLLLQTSLSSPEPPTPGSTQPGPPWQGLGLAALRALLNLQDTPRTPSPAPQPTSGTAHPVKSTWKSQSPREEALAASTGRGGPRWPWHMEACSFPTCWGWDMSVPSGPAGRVRAGELHGWGN